MDEFATGWSVAEENTFSAIMAAEGVARLEAIRIYRRRQMAKGASLNPKDAVAGGAVPDGEATIKNVQAVMFDYGGRTEAGPALFVLYAYPDGSVAEQHYSAGKADKLIPSEDGKRFVHPSGEEAHLGKSSNAIMWIQSMLSGGFPTDRLSDDVSVFEGCRVVIENKAQPKRPGLKDNVEGKAIPLIAKVLALPGARPTASAAKSSATSNAPSTASAPLASNGALDEKAIGAVQEALAAASGNTLTRLKLSTNIMLALSKMKDPDMVAVKKLAGDAAWLAANAENGGWTVQGDSIKLG